MSTATKPTAPLRIGVVGAGQLARMMGEAAHEAGVTVTVLASSSDDSAVATSDAVIIGAPDDEASLEALARVVDVVTFDHELVDLDQVARLEHSGVTVRPGSRALRFATDKAHQRTFFADVGVPVPRFLVVESEHDPALRPFLEELGESVVKAARGGYDGRGVLFARDPSEAITMVASLAASSPVVVEERLALRAELAQVVVRGVDATCVAYPLVTTVQEDGMCVEVSFPAQVDQATTAEAAAHGHRIAELIDAVGVVAVEFFLTDEGLVVNEVALRPHNTGHWTIEGAMTSQFANHLLAVSGQALGATAPVAAAAVMVNVVGGAAPGSIDAARAVTGAHVHDYGKSWRPGRKLGHVTVVGDDLALAHVTAWESARAYGTRTREA